MRLFGNELPLSLEKLAASFSRGVFLMSEVPLRQAGATLLAQELEQLTPLGPLAYVYGRVLGGCVFL